MNKSTNYTLTSDELSQLEAAISYDQRAEVVQRATAVRMLHLGYKPDQVAQVMLVRRTTISNWWRRWQAGGVEHLANRPKSGRRSKGTVDYWERLDQLLQTDPTHLGYPFTVWTVQRLQQHLSQETGIDLSSERLRVHMRQRGYVWRRPKHVLKPQQDPALRQAALDLLDQVKKEPLLPPSSYSMWTKRV